MQEAKKSNDPDPVRYPECNNHVDMRLISNFHRFKGYNHKNHCFNAVQDFLAQLAIQVTDYRKAAISWLELYILYREQGYINPIRDNPRKAR